MKVRISATVEEKNNKYLDSLLKNSKYRNKSHVIDTAIELLKEKEESENGK
jgi:Arc/MetJ-type ribon-helix-helix transcriptional regulator